MDKTSTQARATRALRTLNGDRLNMRHRTPGTQDGSRRRKTKSKVSSKERDGEGVIIDIKRGGEAGYSDY